MLYSKSTTQYRWADDWNQVSYFIFTVHAKETFKYILGNVTMKWNMVWCTELLRIWWHHISTRIIICVFIITTAHQEHLCLWNHTRESKCLSWWFHKCQIVIERSLIHKKGNIIATHWKDKRDGICHFSHPWP